MSVFVPIDYKQLTARLSTMKCSGGVSPGYELNEIVCV
jgi:hypothetical protein